MDSSSAINEKVTALTQALGLSENDIKVVRPDWLALMKRGVIVNLHLRRWRAVATLTPEHLGIDFQDEDEKKAFEKTMRLGQVYLLPDRFIKGLASLDSLMRKTIDKFALKTHWGNMMTAESYKNWQDEFDQQQAKYYQYRDDLYNNWADITLEVADSHMANARAAYRRLEAQERITGKPSTIVRDFSEAQFVANYVDAIIKAIPGPGEVYDSFAVESDLSFIPLPSLMAEDEAQAQAAYERLESERQAIADEEKLRREVVANYKKRLDSMVVDYMAGIVGQLNEALYEAASDILGKVDQSKNLHPRSIVQLKGAIEKVKALNFFGYDDIEKMVSQAESIVSSSSEGRSMDEVTTKLSDIVEVTRATLVSLGERPARSARAMAEVEIDPLAKVRQARARLGLAEVEEQIPQTRQARASI